MNMYPDGALKGGRIIMRCQVGYGIEFENQKASLLRQRKDPIRMAFASDYLKRSFSPPIIMYGFKPFPVSSN